MKKLKNQKILMKPFKQSIKILSLMPQILKRLNNQSELFCANKYLSNFNHKLFEFLIKGV